MLSYPKGTIVPPFAFGKLIWHKSGEYRNSNPWCICGNHVVTKIKQRPNRKGIMTKHKDEKTKPYSLQKGPFKPLNISLGYQLAAMQYQPGQLLSQPGRKRHPLSTKPSQYAHPG